MGTSIRQKAESVTQIEIMPEPPSERAVSNPWPYYAKILKTSTSHEEGCKRFWSLSTVRFTGADGKVTGVETEEVEWTGANGKSMMTPIPGTRRIIEADLVLLALGFDHPVLDGLLAELGVALDARNNVMIGKDHSTSVPGVFAAGDTVNGASLVVRAIASGRSVAREIDSFLNRDADE